MVAPMRVVLSGAGYIAPVHIEGWRAAGVEVVAIADPDSARAHFIADRYALPHVYDNLEAALAKGGIDILDIASPRQVHTAQCRLGLDLGLAVMCQKPLAPTLDEAFGFAATVGDDDRIMVHENWRFRPPYRKVREWIDTGRVGTIRHVEMQMRTSAMLPDGTGTRPAARRQPFMLKEPRLVIAEVLIHHIDTLRSLVGELDLQAARGVRADPELPGETSAMLYLTGNDGLPVLLSGDMTANGAPPGATDRLEILGSSGRVVLEGDLLRLAGPKPEEIDYAGRDLLAEGAAATIAHFVERLPGGGPFETGLRDNLATLSLVERAYRMIGGEA